MLKKVSLSLFASLTLLLNVAVPFAHAQVGPWYNQNPAQWYTKVYDSSNPQEIFGERYTAAQVQWIIYTVITFPLTFFLNTGMTSCLLGFVFGGGADINECFSDLTSDAGPQSTLDQALATIQQEQAIQKPSIISQIFADRPLSGITYVKDKARDFHLIPQAQAQSPGFGYAALAPIQTLWSMSRNVTYALMVLVVITMAFMIMFRTKVTPQTVITVQSALPKVIVTIILITFSYAIAGFVVDLVYVVLGFVSLIFSASLNTDGPTLFSLMMNGPANTGILGIFITYIISFLFGILIVLITSFGILGAAATTGVFAIIGAITAGTVPVVAAVIGLILLLIFFIIAVWNGIKTMWALVKSFSTVLLLIIFAPFQIALGAVYKGTGFAAWLTSLIANLAVFIVVNVLLVFSFLFLGEALNQSTFTFGQNFGSGLLSTLLGSAAVGSFSGATVQGWPPLLAFSTQFIWLATSFVLFMTIPTASELTKSLIAGKPFAFGSAIGVPGSATAQTAVSSGTTGGIAGGASYIMQNRPWVSGSGFSLGGLGKQMATGAKGAIQRGLKIGP